MAKIKLTESELSKLLYESMVQTFLNEAFKSSQLRDWMRQHGGVKNRYDEPEFAYVKDKRVSQDGLGDVTDDVITSMEEFDNLLDAEKYCWSMNHPMSKNSGVRQPFDSKTLFKLYRAKDGHCLVVGLDKSKVDTTPTWGAEVTKKKGDRYWNNGEGRYVDDSDTYYYNSPAKDFGLHTNHNYQGKLHDIASDKDRSDTPEQHQEWREREHQNMHDYLSRHYPNVEKHLQKK